MQVHLAHALFGIIDEVVIHYVGTLLNGYQVRDDVITEFFDFMTISTLIGILV